MIIKDKKRHAAICNMVIEPEVKEGEVEEATVVEMDLEKEEENYLNQMRKMEKKETKEEEESRLKKEEAEWENFVNNWSEEF